MSAGILESGFSWLERMHPGWAAHGALTAVSLAKAGFLGPDLVFEGKRGLYASHLQRVPEGDRSPTFRLGETWQTLGIALKPYPCCHFIHAFVDATLELRGTFALEDVVRIECPLASMLHPLVAEPRMEMTHPTNV